jgi:hypothetical protein
MSTMPSFVSDTFAQVYPLKPRFTEKDITDLRGKVLKYHLNICISATLAASQ